MAIGSHGKMNRLFMMFLFKNKRFVSACLVLFIVFIILISDYRVLASSGSGNGVSWQYLDSSIPDYFGITSPYPLLSNSTAETLYDSDGFNSSTLSPNFAYGTTENVLSGNWSGSGNTWIIPTQVINNNITYDVSVGYTILCNSPNSSYNTLYSLRVGGSGHFAIVQNYIVSDDVFSVIVIRSDAYQGTHNYAWGNTISVPSGNGFYCYDIRYDLDSNANICYTDMSIYRSSLDGDSGFTNFSISSSDLDLSGNTTNYEFNNLLNQDLIIDNVNGGSGEDSLNSVGKHYNFAYLDVRYSGFEDSSGFLLDTRWTFNDYIMQHPEEYQIHLRHVIHVHGSTTSVTIDFISDEIVPLGSVLANDDTKYSRSYPFSVFRSGSLPLTSFLADEWEAGSGASSGYYDDDNILSYGSGHLNSTRSFGGFKIGVNDRFINRFSVFDMDCEIFLEFIAGDIETTSGSFKATYNFLSGQTDITQNDISTNLDPMENQPPTSYNYKSSGGSGGGGSVIQNANPTIIVNGSNDSLSAFKIDDVNIANVADTMNTIITTLGNNRNTNGFWQLMKNVYDFLPPEIWEMIALGCATVLGIAIVKVTLSYRR